MVSSISNHEFRILTTIAETFGIENSWNSLDESGEDDKSKICNNLAVYNS